MSLSIETVLSLWTNADVEPWTVWVFGSLGPLAKPTSVTARIHAYRKLNVSGVPLVGAVG